MMQREGKARYLKYHQGTVISVSFHPKDRFLFCSGAYDGKVNLYSCQRYEFLQSYIITSVSLARNVNAVRFNCEGDRILVSTTARKLSVIDVTRGDQILAYDNCTFNGRDRTGLATDPTNPNIAVSCCVNGRGIVLFDLRMQLPLDFVYDIHTEVIRDVIFLHRSWPWCGGETTLVTAGEDGFCRILTMDGRCLHTISANQPLNAVTITPELYDSGLDDGFCSLLMMGGSNICAYVPNEGIKETHRQNKTAPVWKLRYTSNGSLLYSACDNGAVHRYRRWPDHHGYLGEVLRHKSEVADMDISPYDEYLVTASKDRSVGIMKLGEPNHGASEYSELT